MRSFWELTGFEFKKIFSRRGTAIALLLATVVTVLTPAGILMGNYYVEGEAVESHYEAMVTDRAHVKALEGRTVDGALFREMKEAYAKLPAVAGADTLADYAAYDQYARPYGAVFGLLTNVYRDINSTNFKEELTDGKMDGYYSARIERLTALIGELPFSESIKGKFIANAEAVPTPFRMAYVDGYYRFFTIMYTTAIIVAFVAAILLAPMFAGEYGTRTSQLILSSRHGKGRVIAAKLFTGVTLSVGLFLLFTLLTALICHLIFGLEGGGSPLELISRYPGLPYGLTVFQMALAYTVVTVLAGVLTGAFTMLLSSRMKAPFGVIIIVGASIIVPMVFNAPTEFLPLYQAYQLLPANMMYSWAAVGYPYEIFGFGVPPYLFLPLFAAAASAVMLPLAHRFFKGHQQG